MKFSTREDIETPADIVFARVTDFAMFERRALRHGAEVKRLDDGPVEVGSAWDASFTFRGRERNLRAKVTSFDAPNSYEVETVSGGLTGLTRVELVALSKVRTRIMVSVELRAKSLTARVLLQSLKLAKGKLNKRFKARILELSEDIEEAYRKSG